MSFPDLIFEKVSFVVILNHHIATCRNKNKLTKSTPTKEQQSIAEK